MIISIDETSMAYLELLNFEVVSLKLLLQKIVVKSKDLENYEVKKDALDYYIEKYKEINTEFELFKRSLINEYVPEDKRHFTVTFNFENCTLSFDE